MANLLEQYGIKEVADVTIYEIHEDGSTSPVLFLDTLKVSTIEQTAEQTEARGGKGNPPLIIWDYGKEITVTLEDALFSPASMAIMFGDDDGLSAVSSVTRMVKKALTAADIASLPTGSTKWYTGATEGKGMVAITTTTGLKAGQIVYEESTVSTSVGTKIEITAEKFPGTYKLVGETFARNRKTGKDEYFQFVIPQAKMSSENTITLEAEGDPSVFNMTMRVLRPDSGAMMELIQYSLPDSGAAAASYSAPANKGSLA